VSERLEPAAFLERVAAGEKMRLKHPCTMWGAMFLADWTMRDDGYYRWVPSMEEEKETTGPYTYEQAVRSVAETLHLMDMFDKRNEWRAKDEAHRGRLRKLYRVGPGCEYATVEVAVAAAWADGCCDEFPAVLCISRESPECPDPPLDHPDGLPPWMSCGWLDMTRLHVREAENSCYTRFEVCLHIDGDDGGMFETEKEAQVALRRIERLLIDGQSRKSGAT